MCECRPRCYFTMQILQEGDNKMKKFDVYLTGRIGVQAPNQEDAEAMVKQKLNVIHPMFNIQIMITKEDYLDGGEEYKPEGTE